MRRAALLALLAGLAVPAAAPAAPLFGFNDASLQRGYSAGQVLPLLQRQGAEVLRIDVEWRHVEPSPGNWRWSELDRVVATARRGGLRPLLIVRSAPRWAQDGNVLACGVTPPGSCHRPPAPGRLGEWGEFVRRVARRYPDAVGIEVFNEPNYPVHNWRPRADAVAYTAVLRAAHRAVKSVRPGMPVIFGGLLNLAEGGTEGPSAERFLADAYAAGARGAMDGIGLHPYGYPGDARPAGSAFRRTLDGIRGVRRRAGDSATPLWITEVGYHTGPVAAGGVSEAAQAERLPAAVRLALAQPDVRAVIVHSLIDAGRDPGNLLDHFGLVRPDLSPKPALAALAQVRGRPAVSVLRVRRSRLRLRLSEPARVALRLTRRSRRGRWPTVRRMTRSLPAGESVVKLRRRGALRRGRYRVRLLAADATGERSPLTRAGFRVRRR